MSYLIIGKNSKIVSAIASKLVDFDFISHDEVFNTDLSKYKLIYLFSWRFLGGNLQLLKLLPADRLVLISTIAVQANYICEQRKIYPFEKLEAEKYVLELGGSVIRLAIWDLSQLKKLVGAVPVTTPELLINLLNSGDIKKGEVYTPFVMMEGLVKGFRRRSYLTVQNFLIPYINHKSIQIIYMILGRLFSLHNYGYTGLALLFFNDTVQLGFGAFGGFYYKNNFSGQRVVVSNLKFNKELIHCGFNGTLIGSTPQGLSSMWHGVYLVKKSYGYVKNILRFGKSYFIPAGSLYANVESISYLRDVFTLNISTSGYAVFQIFCKKLILAAGTIENSRLLKSFDNLQVTFDDHELALVGEIYTTDAIETGCLQSRLGLFLSYKKSIVVNDDDIRFLIDVRPKIGASESLDLAFYNASFFSIIKKVFKSKSVSRINESIFCRFGIAFKTKKCSVFVQLLTPDCIKFGEDYSLKRERASSERWIQVENQTKYVFPTFTKSSSITSIDAQHVWGARQLVSSEIVRSLIKSDALRIVGSPAITRLDSLHHTVQFRASISNK